MAFSYEKYPGDGTTKIFSVPFSFILREHVDVQVDGTPVSFSWLSDTQVQCAVAPALGTIVSVSRDTPKDAPIVDFVDGTVLTEEALDLNTLQTLFIAQESADATADSITLAVDDKWDGNDKRFKDLVDPVNPQDAATKNYVDTAGDSFVVQAETEASNAAASAASAAASAASASSSAGSANSAKTGAETARTLAQSAQSAAESAESNANASEIASSTSESNASTSAAGAFTSETNAANSAASASSDAAAAAASKALAETAAANAAAAASVVTSKGYKNALMNARFEVNERNVGDFQQTSGGVKTEYMIDRWEAGTWDATADFFINDISTEQNFFNKVIGLDIVTNNITCFLMHTIEDVRTFAGETVTFSAYFRKRNGYPDMSVSVQFQQNYGTGSSDPVNVMNVGSFTVTNDVLWIPHSVTFEMPSVYDKDIKNGDNHVLLQLSTGNSTGGFRVAAPQLELGSQATTFETPDNAVESLRCARFYYKARRYELMYDGGSGATAGTNTLRTRIQHPIPMRATPTLTASNVTTVGGTLVVDGATDNYFDMRLLSSGASDGPRRVMAATIDVDADF